MLRFSDVVMGERATVAPLPPQRATGKAEPVAVYVLLAVRDESSGTSP